VQSVVDQYRAMPSAMQQMVASQQAQNAGLGPTDLAQRPDLNNPMLFALGAGNIGGGIRAFHGSPHDFDAFDLSKIGTGEGAQAYGHGLYMAENPSVAEAYRVAGLRGGPIQYQGRGIRELPNNDLAALPDLTRRTLGRIADDSHIDEALQNAKSDGLTDIAGEIERLQREGLIQNRPRGRMYEVNINADPEHFLDWDKPLSQQPERVQKALEPYGYKPQPEQMSAFDDALLAALNDTGPATLPKQPPNPSGEAIYRALGSERLRDAGLPGIRYLDQGSRTAGEGSHNYVVFNDSLIDILRKYGLLPPAALGAAASQYPDQN
jgi:hypothetical protein